MSTTLNIQNAINFAQQLVKNQQMLIANFEPAMTMGNIVLQRMLGAPFVWRFNRANLEIPISGDAGTDYALYVPDLGRIESMWITDGTGMQTEMKGAISLAKVSTVRQPVSMAPQYDDNMGNVTFRMNSVPDDDYTVSADYQRKPRLLATPADSFAPVPDEFGYLFNKGFLAEAAAIVNDSRFELWRREFLYGLLATQDGLDAQAKDIFLAQMMNAGTTAAMSNARAQQGSQGRAI